jgi:hypothetical protein
MKIHLKFSERPNDIHDSTSVGSRLTANLSPKGDICFSRGREPAVSKVIFSTSAALAAALERLRFNSIPKRVAAPRLTNIPLSSDRGLTPTADTNVAAPPLGYRPYGTQPRFPPTQR